MVSQSGAGLRRGVWVAGWIVALLASAPAVSTPGAAPAPGPTAVNTDELIVFAAASLTDVLEEVDAAFTAESEIRVRASYAASSVLARQIEAGAPADAFFSADREWMDYLEKRALIRPQSRRDLLGNALVIIAPANSALHLRIAPRFNLAGALGNGLLATADPDAVPAGLYARAALTKLGVWGSVADRLARADNVRLALEYVARGEAPVGIVYRTDAIAEKRVRIVDTFPEDSHPPITYPVALTASSHRARASSRYLDFVESDAARQIFERRGFVPLGVAHSVRTR